MSSYGKIRIKTRYAPVGVRETTHVFGVGGPVRVPVRVSVLEATNEVTIHYEPSRVGARTLATLMAQAVAREWAVVDIAPLGMYTDTSRWRLPKEDPQSFKASVGPYSSWAHWLEEYKGDNVPLGYDANQVSADTYFQMSEYVRALFASEG